MTAYLYDCCALNTAKPVWRFGLKVSNASRVENFRRWEAANAALFKYDITR
jgi:hypothetical protein